MKKQLSFTILTIVSLAAVLLSMSCGETPPTNNTVATANNTSVKSDAGQDILADCSGDPSEKVKKIKEGVGKNIGNISNLSSQYNRKNFQIEPVADNDQIVLYISGYVYTTSPKDINVFNGVYTSYIVRGCVSRIVFDAPPVTGPTPSPSPSPEPASPDMSQQKSATASARFEFIACEAPNVLCSDGSCRQQGTCDGAVPPPNTNANIDTNTNSNVKTNANR